MGIEYGPGGWYGDRIWTRVTCGDMGLEYGPGIHVLIW